MTVYAMAWIPMVIIAIGNGVAREFTYGRAMSELRAHQTSTLTGILLLGVYMFAVLTRWPTDSSKQAFQVGGLWVVLTILFEFGFGHYVAGHPWTRLLGDYNLRAGRVWVFVLVWVGVAPWLFHTLRIA